MTNNRPAWLQHARDGWQHRGGQRPTFAEEPGPGQESVWDTSRCEWKGAAEYLAVEETTEPVGWRYPNPYTEFADHAGWISFYPGRVGCTVDGEMVRPQASGFYGGWITDEVVGPFKGESGTSGW